MVNSANFLTSRSKRNCRFFFTKEPDRATGNESSFIQGINGKFGELEEQLTRKDQVKNELERSLSTARQILRDNQAQRSPEMDSQEAHFRWQLGMQK